MKNRSVTRAGKPGYASAPGQPPHAHAMGKGDSGGLKYGPFNILYGYDPVRRSVVIGPRKKPNSKNVPAVLEYGASAAVGRWSGKTNKPIRFGLQRLSHPPSLNV